MWKVDRSVSVVSLYLHKLLVLVYTIYRVLPNEFLLVAKERNFLDNIIIFFEKNKELYNHGVDQ